MIFPQRLLGGGGEYDAWSKLSFHLRYAIICQDICPAVFRQISDRIPDRTFFWNPTGYQTGLDIRCAAVRNPMGLYFKQAGTGPKLAPSSSSFRNMQRTLLLKFHRFLSGLDYCPNKVCQRKWVGSFCALLVEEQSLSLKQEL